RRDRSQQAVQGERRHRPRWHRRGVVVASKQVAGPVQNAERARATEATFGKSGDPWRDSPALAGLGQALSPHKEVRGQGTSSPGDEPWTYCYREQAQGPDRYGTAGVPAQAPEGYAPGQRAEKAQR